MYTVAKVMELKMGIDWPPSIKNKEKRAANTDPGKIYKIKFLLWHIIRSDSYLKPM